MDTRLSYEDWKDYLSHCAQKQGPSHAMNQCEAHLGEIVCKDPFLAGMKEALQSPPLVNPGGCCMLRKRLVMPVITFLWMHFFR